MNWIGRIFPWLLWAACWGRAAAAAVPPQAVPFDSGAWTMVDARTVEHLGRKGLVGTAFLKDVALEDVVVEVDVACTGARSYPGVLFRMQSPGETERVYLRPHRAGPAGYPDAVQYVPTWNGVDSWQLYNGDGVTAGALLPHGEWVPLRIEVKGRQARVYVGDLSRPALIVHDLKRDPEKGFLGLNGPRDGSAVFSNFRYMDGSGLVFDPPPPRHVSPGIVTEWEIAGPVKAAAVPRDAYPSQAMSALGWTTVRTQEGGLLDFSRHLGRLGASPDCSFARIRIASEGGEVKKFRFGYSDEVAVFLNGAPVFSGDSTYRFRDPSFLGIVGLFDALYLPLRKGENEVLFAVTENMGGWGLILQDASAVFEAPGVRGTWTTGRSFALPETVVRDPSSGALYVSNYDGYNPSGAEGRQSIARVNADGTIVNPDWARGLRNPTGMAVSGGTLFVVEPTGLAEVETATGRLLTRHPVEGAAFLNDAALGPDGALYLSDSRRSVLYRFAGGKAEEWLSGPEISRPNGLHVVGGELLVGNGGDGRLKAVDLTTKAVRVVADLGPGILDGIESDGAGSLLVSQNEGRLFRVGMDGRVTKLLDTTAVGMPLANFAFLPESGLLVFSTWTDNRVAAYALSEP
ncbi:MAG: hypothetical protein ACOYXN_05940 [Acidobacteriota bacterium]